MGHKVIRLLLLGLCVHRADCGTVHTQSVFGQGLSTSEPSANIPRHQKKKADVSEHPEVFDHVGLLVNEPPGTAGLFFI